MRDIQSWDDRKKANSSNLTTSLQSPDSYSSRLENDSDEYYKLDIPEYFESDATPVHLKSWMTSGKKPSNRFNNDTNNGLNGDLMSRALDDNSSGSNDFPILDHVSLEGLDLDFEGLKPFYPIEVQTTLAKPYFMLEIASCACSSMTIYSNIFMFAIISDRYPSSTTDIFMRYIMSKGIILGGIGIVSYVFTSPDTYKSVSCTLKILITNAIIYEYKTSVFAKYILIHLLVTVLVALFAIGIFHDFIKDIDNMSLLNNVFTSRRSYDFSASYILVACIMHIASAIGIIILTNDTTSVNAKTRVVNKYVLLFILSITFGAIIGPIGYVWPSLVLYSMIIITRGAFEVFNMNLFIIYAGTVLLILFVYPFIALQIKFIWRKKYIRYIEY